MFVFFVSYRYVRIKRESMCRVGVSGESGPNPLSDGDMFTLAPQQMDGGVFYIMYSY